MRLQFGDCLFDSETREVFRKQKPVHLSPNAFSLLELLLEARPRALPKDELHDGEVTRPGSASLTFRFFWAAGSTATQIAP